MANDLSSLFRIGELIPRDGLNYPYPKTSEVYGNRLQLCGRAYLEGDKHVVSRPQNATVKSQFAELSLMREVIGHKELRGNKRNLLLVLNAVRFLECSSRVQHPNGDRSADIQSKMSEPSPFDSGEHDGLPWPSSNCKSLSSPEWETLTKTRNGFPRGYSKERTVYDWIILLRRLQKVDAYFDIANALTSQLSVVEPGTCSDTDVVRTLEVSEKKRGFSVTAGKSKSYFAFATMKSSGLRTSFPRRRVRKSSIGRLQRTISNCTTLLRIGVGSPQQPSNCDEVRRLLPLLLRRSQSRFKLRTPEENKTGRVPAQVTVLSGFWRFSWSADAERKATVIQAQWRMCSARRQYQTLRHVAIILQRQWRQSRSMRVTDQEMTVSNFVRSDICSTIQELHDLATIEFTAESSCNEVAGENTQRSSRTPGCPVQLFCDDAMLQEKVCADCMNFVPPPERDLNANGLSSSTLVFSDPSRVSSAVLEEISDEDPQSPPSKTKTWNYDPCNLDSPACSPAKELTFAKISIDGSLPPTPIKEWSSRQRDLAMSPAAVTISWDYCANNMDHHSPTKDWATPPEKVRKSSFLLADSLQVDSNLKRFQLPSEWFADFDDSNVSENCWDTSKVTSIAFSPPSDPSLKPLHGFTEVLTSREQMMVPTSSVLVFGLKDSEKSGLPFHQNSEVLEVATSKFDKKIFASCKHTSLKVIDSSHSEVVPPSERDVDSIRLSTANVSAMSTDYSLSPELEEELLHELTKLFEGPPSPAACTYHSAAPGDCCRSITDLHCPRSVRICEPKSLRGICKESSMNNGFSHSARKLDFNLKDFDKREGDKVSQEECRHIEGTCISATEMDTMVEEQVQTSSPVITFPIPTAQELAIPDSNKLGDILDGIEAKFLGISEELDDVKASRNSLCYSETCQSTDQAFLQLVNQKPATSDDAPEQLHRGLEGSLSSKRHGSRSLLITFANEDDFCDKALDGSVVDVKSTTRKARNFWPDAIHSIGRETVLANESLNPGVGHPVAYPAVDWCGPSSTRDHTTFLTPKAERSRNPLVRSCSRISKSKPPLPTSRRFSFDESNLTPKEDHTPDRKRLVLMEKNVSERLLHNSPASPDTPLDWCSAVLSSQERSKTLSLSKKYFLQSPLTRKDHGKTDSDAESVSSPNLSPSKLESAFAELKKNAGKKHARALFDCQESSISQTTMNDFLSSGINSEMTGDVLESESHIHCDGISHHSCFEDNYETMLKQSDNHRLWIPEELSGSLIDTSGQELDCSFRRTTSSGWVCGFMSLMSDGGVSRSGNSAPCLHDLCKVWEEESIDLVTRSLKYKLLMIDPVLLRHEVNMAHKNSDSFSSRTPHWEIQSIERLKEQPESKEAIKEVIKNQRDTIYTNIATNTSMGERYRLYSKWGIRRMSTGRLRRLVYELLWKDPKRFHASADLVIEYL